jgi:DNA polymerase III alpha subunit
MTVLNLDQYSRQIYSESDAVRALYFNPGLDISKLDIAEVDEFNQASKLLFSGITLKKTVELDCSVEDYHKQNQNSWHMPKEYADFDISEWCLMQCNDNQDQLQRVGKELIMYQERNMLPLLNFLRYFIAVMREKDIVWGVGRGSSVASYVLYLIGVHKIDSLFFDLDIEDFLR